MQPQVILFTGASSGFDKISAQMLAEQAHIVSGTSRKRSEHMDRVKMLMMDVSNPSSIQKAVERISEQGCIDALVNNAEIGIGEVMEILYQGFYSASKFAVEDYSEASALEVHPFGIKVCLI